MTTPLALLRLLAGRRRGAGGALALLALLGRLEDLEGAHQRVVDGHHRAGVVKLAAVVGGGEDRHQLPLGEELVAVLDHLVRAAHEVEVVLVEKGGDDVGAEGVGDGRGRSRPSP